MSPDHPLRRFSTTCLLLVCLRAAIPGACAEPATSNVEDIDPSQALLDPAKQQYIWNAEHFTHLLEWRFGPQFCRAFESGDRESLASFLRDDFAGTVLPTTGFDATKKSLVVRRKSSSANSKATETDRAGLVAWLVALSASVQSPKKPQFRVLRIGKSADSESGWTVNALVAARGTDEKGGTVAIDSNHRIGMEWKDASEIGEGPIIRRWTVEDVTLTRSPRPLLDEVTAETGLADLPIKDNWNLHLGEEPLMTRFQYAVDDFDNDGFLDLAVATHERNLMLLRSAKGEKFEDVTAKAGLRTFNSSRPVDYSVGWIDFDNDGDPDLLMGGRLYRNDPEGRFVDVTSDSGLRFASPPIGYAIADYDADGFLDIYCAGDRPSRPNPRDRAPGWVGDSEGGLENLLWRNKGDGSFENVTRKAGVGCGQSITLAAAWFFADDDHFPDLYVANDFGSNIMLRNRGDGTFEDVSKPSRTSDYATSMGVATGDLDNDGRPEIYVANMFSKAGRRVIAQVSDKDYPPGIFEQIKGACAGNRLYTVSGASQEYTEIAESLGANKVGWAYAPAMVDFDNDGWLDLYATAGFMSFDRKKPDG